MPPIAYNPTQSPYQGFSKAPGMEALPGYRLLDPLGKGGFGEVWRCEAPGGLQKAVKFVTPDPDSVHGEHGFRQEFEAFQQIRSIRHPFLLQLERVELVGGDLVMVMELADAQLADRFDECLRRGLPGIPRDELLGYLADAAEALDVISAKHGLQHLDVKPANLFLVGGHVKVGDYGLVVQFGAQAGGDSNRGLTPRYVAPEVLRGQVDPRSDQYSLALVYQELLTGTFPYVARNPQQMMMMHVTAAPDLNGLPPQDRDAVRKALSKKPEDRFGSCLGFVRNLVTATSFPDSRTPTDAATMFRTARLDRQVAELTNAPRTTPGPIPQAPESLTHRSLPPLTLPGKPLPPLTTQGQRPPAAKPTFAPLHAPKPAIPEEPVDLVLSSRTPDTTMTGPVKLDPIYSVVPTTRLLGRFAEPGLMGASALIESVLFTAAGGQYVPRVPGEVALRPDGTWSTRFPSTLLAAVVPIKMTMLMEDGWCDEVTQPDKFTFVLKAHQPGGMWGKLSGKKAGAEVTVRVSNAAARASLAGSTVTASRLTPGFGAPARATNFGMQNPAPSGGPREAGSSASEVEVVGNLFGNPDASFTRTATEQIPQLLDAIRRLLGNVDDRRKTPRLAYQAPLTFYPITEDGLVMPPVPGHARDVSAGGFSGVALQPISTRYVFIEFTGVPEVAGFAILTRLTRAVQIGYEQVIAGRFRVDL